MGETLAQLGEFGVIRRLNALLAREGRRAPGVALGIGDDTAVLRPRPGWDLLVTCDCMLEGRHYLPAHTTPHSVGRRAMAINLSDVGAMGGRPLYALVSLGLRADALVEDLEELYRGFLAELNPLGACVIGGNLTKTDHAQFIDVTLFGEVERGGALRRSTARPGDAVLVTGCPGQAAAGLRLLLAGGLSGDPLDAALRRAYCEPSHRAREGRAVAQAGAATAMIDISDGFLGDLGHLCEESGVGAEVVQAHLPVTDALRSAAARLGCEPWALTLGDSDDYELLVTSAPERVDEVRAAVASVGGVPVTQVGRLVEGTGGIELVLPDGGRRRTTHGGWDHFAGGER